MNTKVIFLAKERLMSKVKKCCFLTQLLLGAVVKLVEFEILPSSNKEVLFWVEGGRVNRSWSVHRFDQVQAGRWT